MLRKEVKLIKFDMEIATVDEGMPLAIRKPFEPSMASIDNPITTPMEIYEAEVHVFKDFTGTSYKETRVALDERSQQVVDMFVHARERELISLAEDYRQKWELEKSRTCYGKLVNWLASIRFGRLF